MDRNEKFLKKLSKSEFIAVHGVLQKIHSGDTTHLDMTRLTGHHDVFRVRVRTMRIIFLSNRDKTEILEVSRRSEKTYRDY